MPSLGEMQTIGVAVVGFSVSWSVVLVALLLCQAVVGVGDASVLESVLYVSLTDVEQPSVVWLRTRAV